MALRHRFLLSLTISCAAGALSLVAAEPKEPKAPPQTAHPALFLVGDSIMKTGTGNGETGPWGWGSELGAFFDSTKIHIYNEGHGGRSSRSYIEEGLWTNVLERVQKGDFLLIQFGHNDFANSANYPDRISAKGTDDKTEALGAPVDGKKGMVHTYGWYLRQYIKDAKDKGAVPIICSPVPRNGWAGGKIKRGFEGYADWAATTAKAGGTLFIDLNTLAADKFDALGQAKGASYFNDRQHTTKAGARLNAEAVVVGIRGLKDCPLSKDLLPAGAKSASSAP